MKRHFLSIVAGIGALSHIFFAYQETIGWGMDFVKTAAGSWIDPADQNTAGHVNWAKQLAFNIGIYNLVLAMGLAWTAIADANIKKQLGIYFSVWLLCAAEAAAYTQFYLACLVQGILGLLLLIASIQSQKARV